MKNSMIHFSTGMLLKIFSWLFLIVVVVSCNQSYPPPVDYEKEKEAIMAVIKKEAKTYYEKDLEGWKSTYVMEPYQVRMGYWEGYKNKIQYLKGWDELFDHKMQTRFSRKTTNKWDESLSDIKNVNMRIFPEVAWVTYEQTDWEKDGKTLIGHALGTRVLEKEDGVWKIAYLGYMYYPLEEKEADAE